MRRAKVLIVDDEKLARDRVRRFLGEYSASVPSASLAFEIVEATNGLEALDSIGSFEPEIVFLDVQMPGLTGFDVLRQIERRKFVVVFQTAYDEYALKAFDENACDYLLKPFTTERFAKAVGKALELASRTQDLSGLETTLKKDQGPLRKLTSKQGGKTRLIDLEDVVCFVSRDHYTCLHTADGEFIVEPSLNWLEGQLDPERFARCHRNNIVALSAIRSVGSTTDSTLELSNGMSVPLSRANRKALLDRLR